MAVALPGRVRRYGGGRLRFVGGAPSAGDYGPMVVANARRGLLSEWWFRTPMDWDAADRLAAARMRREMGRMV